MSAVLDRPTRRPCEDCGTDETWISQVLLAHGVTLLLWLAHARASWRRPASVGPFGRLLHLGLPAALAATVMIVFAVDGGNDWFPWPLVLGVELFLGWVAVLALESPLSVVRSSRRARTGAISRGRGIRERPCARRVPMTTQALAPGARGDRAVIPGPSSAR